MKNYLTLASWQISTICLAHQINHAAVTDSILGSGAAARSEFFFSDSGVPLPRPCTVLAWASLCAIGPSVGYLYEGVKVPFTLGRGHFLIPFLPKIRHGEDSTQSLSRTSKYHEKDHMDRIRWGNVYVADAASGELVAKLQNGARTAKEWQFITDRRFHIRSMWDLKKHELIPPLWSYKNEGWHFGVIQPHPGINFTLRDPMIELAQRGFPELAYDQSLPQVRRLLIRFLEQSAAQTWANAYVKAIQDLEQLGSVVRDSHALAIEMKRQDEMRFKDAEIKDSKGGRKRKPIPSDFRLSDLDSIIDKL